MLTITNELITMLAPNAAAIANAKKISQKGGFVKLYKSEDNTFMMGECSGSGKSNYNTTVDSINPEQPVFGCSCPSRQFPCKHGLALLVEAMAGKSFESCEIPADIIERRSKRETRREKQESSEPPKVNKSALAKKMKKQLEGLDLAEQCMNDMLNAGLGTISGNSLKTYTDLAKQLGDYYLPGPQILMKRIILEIESLKDDPGQAEQRYAHAVRYLVQLQAVIKKARHFLSNKLESDQIEVEDSTIYESIGSVWNAAQLKQLGLYKENSELIQLTFTIYYDQAREEYVDIGYWMELETGVISKTLNYRPLRALKHVKQDDTIFDVVQARELYCYPGDLNKRIRWDEFKIRDASTQDIHKIAEHAHKDIASVAKLVKNQIKNTLSDNFAAVLLSYKRIGKIGEDVVLEDQNGQTLLLQNMPDGTTEPTVELLSYVPSDALLEQQVMFGLLYYDAATKRMAMQPCAIITDEQIIRLLY
ncbi:SWIM zinc finger family protein [Paenibacillus mendelii]|uniref:SWIM zinc finger family protein n=1 Tax=Paenibacillus mendelii TaxID=206163 RepID=A0ABV6JDB7_9BACL|nr:SWIM zinc finger family protein [Paenibacillus mendelii]MCQ6561542.1 SWIM zinc finger family protein [Paenibacillus mendelii]